MDALDEFSKGRMMLDMYCKLVVRGGLQQFFFLEVKNQDKAKNAIIDSCTCVQGNLKYHMLNRLTFLLR